MAGLEPQTFSRCRSRLLPGFGRAICGGAGRVAVAYRDRRGIFEDKHEIGSTLVAVTGTTGPVLATWTLLLDGAPVDSAKAPGTFTLHGVLPDGTGVAARVFQSLIGPTEIVVEHQDQALARFSGFVA